MKRCDLCEKCSICARMRSEELAARTEKQRWSNAFLNLRRNFRDIAEAIQAKTA